MSQKCVKLLFCKLLFFFCPQDAFYLMEQNCVGTNVTKTRLVVRNMFVVKLAVELPANNVLVGNLIPEYKLIEIKNAQQNNL